MSQSLGRVQVKLNKSLESGLALLISINDTPFLKAQLNLTFPRWSWISVNASILLGRIDRNREDIAMRHHDQNTTTCIEECLRCYQSCFGMAMTHCLETGGKHIEPKH